LKALLLHKKISFRFVHDIGELLTTLERGKVAIPESVKKAAILTTFAVETRYPGPFEQVSQVELDEAILIAGQVVQWVEEQIFTS
jgi:HEPN domain-containing protein